MENGTGPSNAAERGVNGARRDEDAAEAGNENENEDNENNENDEEEEEDDDEDDDDDHEGPYTPFDLPSKELLHLCGVWVCWKALQTHIGVEVSLRTSVNFHFAVRLLVACKRNGELGSPATHMCTAPAGWRSAFSLVPLATSGLCSCGDHNVSLSCL